MARGGMLDRSLDLEDPEDPEIAYEVQRNQDKFSLRDESDSEIDEENRSNDEDDVVGVKAIPIEEQVEGFEDIERERRSTLEPFNLSKERGEGTFEDGNYIGERDAGAKFDNWLADVDDGQITRAALAHIERAKQQNEAASQLLVPEEALQLLAAILEPSESPIEALHRVADPSSEVALISDACSALVNEIPDVYTLDREELSRIYSRRFGQPFKRKRSAEEHVQWEFMWPDSEEVHGPHAASEMQAWLDHGYFTPDVVVRKVGHKRFLDVSQALFESDK